MASRLLFLQAGSYMADRLLKARSRRASNILMDTSADEGREGGLVAWGPGAPKLEESRTPAPLASPHHDYS